MLPKENEQTEYKHELTNGLTKEVLAFINTQGGSIVSTSQNSVYEY